MSKTLSREVIEELERYKAGPVAPRLRRPEALDRPKISDRYNSAEISRLVAALIMTTQQALSEETGKPTSRSIAA
jgi:ferric-dicitrate binding protein FerR (iron transport regulator)